MKFAMRSDVISKAKRSEVMSRIRGHGNRSTELAVIKVFRRHGITGWRRHQAVFGKPDFIFRKQKVAVFVDGCFWHGCHRHCRRPKGNGKYWSGKILRNQKRDRLVTKTLWRAGWQVLRIWEHELHNAGKIVSKVDEILTV